MWVLCFSWKGFIFFIPFVGEESECGGAFPSSWWNWRIMQCVKVVFYRGWWILHKSRCSIVSERDVGRRRSRDIRLERGGFWGSSDEDGRQLRHRNLSAFINCGPLRTRCPLQRARTHSSLDPFSQHHISFSILPMCFFLNKELHNLYDIEWKLALFFFFSTSFVAVCFHFSPLSNNSRLFFFRARCLLWWVSSNTPPPPLFRL